MNKAMASECARCHRDGDACICGSDRRHLRCSACLQDVNRYEARWIVAPPELEQPVPIHDACVGPCFERFPDMKFTEAPNLEAPPASSPATLRAAGDEPQSAVFIFAAPLHIRVEGAPADIAQKSKARLIEVFDALRTGAERASFTFDPATEEVRITGFAETVDALLRPRSEKPN